MKMSRFSPPVLALVLILLLPAAASAQQVGVKAGVNVATQSDPLHSVPSDSFRTGFVGGVWVRIPWTERFSFQVEALFTEKGTHYEPAEYQGAIFKDTRLRYLETPLLARADFGSSAARFFVVGGGAAALLLDARAHVKFEGEQTVDIGDSLKTADFGLVAGAGVEFGRVTVEGRYTHGLVVIQEAGQTDGIPKNRAFSVMAGVRVR